MRPLIAREGWATIAIVATITGLALLWNLYVALVPGVLLALVVYFFRDPERQPPGDERDVVSAADGRVMWVREVDEPRFLGGPAVAISIFLSVFDVHVNRAPVSGDVAYKSYEPGKFLAAWQHHVAECNERAYTGIQGSNYRVLVVQIAGLAARRILTWVSLGETLGRGERFGMIKFGSCTQVYLPAGSIVLVQPGDQVRGGETVIGRLPH